MYIEITIFCAIIYTISKLILSYTKSIDYSLYEPREGAGYPMEKRYELEWYIEFDEYGLILL